MVSAVQTVSWNSAVEFWPGRHQPLPVNIHSEFVISAVVSIPIFPNPFLASADISNHFFRHKRRQGRTPEYVSARIWFVDRHQTGFPQIKKIRE